MANLVPTPSWDGVYQIETTDQVLGGPGGVANTPAQNLANQNLFARKHGGAMPFLPGLAYDIGDAVRLTSGEEVESSVEGNTSDPNLDLTNWKLRGKGNVYALGVLPNERVVSLAGAVRVGADGVPFLISNASHTPYGLTGVEVGPESHILRVRYENGFTRVGTLVATADETLAPYFISAGGSVGLDFADLHLIAPLYFTMLGSVISGVSPLWSSFLSVADSSANHVTLNTPLKAVSNFQPVVSSKNNSADTRTYTNLTAYSTDTALKITAWKESAASCRINWNGTALVASMSNLTGISAVASGNQITITHPAAAGSNAASGRNITPYSSPYNYRMTSVSSTTTVLTVFAADGTTPVSVMDSNVSFFFTYSPLDTVIAKANIADKEMTVFAGYYYVPVTALGGISGGNIWVNGGMVK